MMKASQFVASLLLVSVASTAWESQAQAAPPNVVVFLVDDMGPMDTSVPFMTDDEGNPKRYPLNNHYRTPGMERLAAQGIRFSNFYAMSVCSPTRTSIITGQNAARHRVTQYIAPNRNNRGRFGPPEWRWVGVQDDSVTLAGRLRENGYRTIYVGKAHFGPLGQPSEWPTNLGYEENIAGWAWGQPGSYYGEKNYGNNGENQQFAVPHLEKYHGTDTFLTEALTLEAKDHVSNAVAEGKPFFLHMAHYAVHAPFNSDPRFAPHYADTEFGKPAQAFATLIEGMDKSLGDLMDHLKELGVAENTLILFLGDNGSDAPLGESHEHTSSFPLRGKKATHYEGGIRTPFIAAWAQPNPENEWQKKLPIAPNAVQQQLGTVMDIYPTILHLTGSKPADGHTIDGFNLAPQLRGNKNPNRPERFLMHYPHDHRSSYFTTLRIGDWKVIYHYQKQGKGRYELYNLADDPFEDKNLASEKPDELKRMMTAMIEELETEDALYPIDEAGNETRPQLPEE